MGGSPGVSLDDSIQKLGDFCAALTAANTNLENNTTHLDAQAAHLEDSARATGDELQELTNATHGFATRFDDLEGQAEQELERAAAEAHAASDGTLGALDQGLEDRGEAVETALLADGDELNQSYAETQSNFEALSATVEQARGEMDHVQAELDGAYAALDSALTTLGQEVETARSEGVQALDDAAAQLHDEEQVGLEADASGAASDWTGELSSNLESATDSVEQALVAAYQTFDSDALTAGDELIGGMATVARTAAESLVSESGNELDLAAESIRTASADSVAAELDQMATGLEAHVQTTQALEPMIGELERVKAVIADIAALLESMQ